MKGKHPKDFTRRLLSIPGIREAIGLVEFEARKQAIKEALKAGEKSKFGEKLRLLLRENNSESKEKFLDDDLIKSYIGDSIAELLETLAIKASPKIAELWGLSEIDQDFLVDFFYYGDDDHSFMPLKFVIKSYDLTLPKKILDGSLEPKIVDAVVGNTGAMQNGHIFLDVTYLLYESLRSAYGTLLIMRERLGIECQDLQVGAPESIDTEKALACVDLAELGYTQKEIAKELDFPISCEDNPSGSYPLLRKYLKRGREINKKLEALGSFLDSVKT